MVTVTYITNALNYLNQLVYKKGRNSMNEHKIETGNRLLAEMMGWVNISSKYNPLYQHQTNSTNIGTVHKPILLSQRQFRYHTSWDELMPVVKYINHQKDDAPQQIWDKIEIGVIGLQEIEIAWQGCVDYAKWKQNNKNKSVQY